jgi:hypothetical protein
MAAHVTKREGLRLMKETTNVYVSSEVDQENEE